MSQHLTVLNNSAVTLTALIMMSRFWSSPELLSWERPASHALTLIIYTRIVKVAVGKRQATHIGSVMAEGIIYSLLVSLHCIQNGTTQCSTAPGYDRLKIGISFVTRLCF